MRQIVIACLSAMIAVLLFQSDARGEWKYGNVVSGLPDDISMQIDVDSLDRSHIVYFDSEREQLAYIWLAPEGWRFETIAATPFCNFDFALDWNLNPHVIWYDRECLFHSVREAGTWETFMLYGPLNLRRNLVLDIDHLNRPVIAFLVNRALIKGVKTGSDWKYTVCDTGITPGHLEMVLDSRDNPHLTYQADGPFYYLHEADGSWTRTLLDAEDPEYGKIAGIRNSIVVDQSNRPHIGWVNSYGYWYYETWGPPGWPDQWVYIGWSESYYSFMDEEDQWHTTEFDRNAHDTLGISVALDLFGKPMITTSDHSFYTRSDSGDWDRNDLDLYDPLRFLTSNWSGEPVIISNETPTMKIAWNEPDIRYRLLMPDTFMESGDEFLLSRLIRNNTGDVYVAGESIVLQAAGGFWFYPDWSRSPQSQPQFIDASANRTEEILRFTWPKGTHAMTGLDFFGTLTDLSSNEILGVSRLEFQIAGY